MKKLVMTGMAGLMAASLISDMAFARRSVRQVLSKEVVRERILKRIGETKSSESAYETLVRARETEVLDAVAEGMRSEGIGLPKSQLTDFLKSSESNSTIKEATKSESGQTLVENVELALAIKEGVRDGSLATEGLTRNELTQLESAATNALHLVANLASVDAVKLTPRGIKGDSALEAMIRQVSQIEALLKDYTQAERDSWNKQLESFKNYIGNNDAIAAYKESIRDVVAKERGIEKTEVTEEMLKEKLEEIKRCKA